MNVPLSDYSIAYVFWNHSIIPKDGEEKSGKTVTVLDVTSADHAKVNYIIRWMNNDQN